MPRPRFWLRVLAAAGAAGFIAACVAVGFAAAHTQIDRGALVAVSAEAFVGGVLVAWVPVRHIRFRSGSFLARLVPGLADDQLADEAGVARQSLSEADASQTFSRYAQSGYSSFIATAGYGASIGALFAFVVSSLLGGGIGFAYLTIPYIVWQFLAVAGAPRTMPHTDDYAVLRAVGWSSILLAGVMVAVAGSAGTIAALACAFFAIAAKRSDRRQLVLGLGCAAIVGLVAVHALGTTPAHLLAIAAVVGGRVLSGGGRIELGRGVRAGD
ncbi:MAG TPA: hypothetical protein VHD87_14875 [Acidimicrobiales bacterium]|nr:hypothetical protein [Acidimicrobiales bacterium]